MTLTVEPIVHQRALQRLTTQPTVSNYLKERAARQQCLIANGGVPCTCGPVPAAPSSAVPQPRVPHPHLSQAERLKALEAKAEAIERNTTSDCITLMEEAKVALAKKPLNVITDLKNKLLAWVGR